MLLVRRKTIVFRRTSVLLWFIRPPETIVFGRTYVSRMMFFYFFFPREISAMRGPTNVKFCTMVNTGPNFIMPLQNFVGRTPKKFQGLKTCKI